MAKLAVKAINAPVAVQPTEKEISEYNRLKALIASTRPAAPRIGVNVELVNPAPADEDRLPRQAKHVLAVLRTLKGKAVQNAIESALTPILHADGYRQDGHRIFTFYRGRLIKEGRIRCSS